jgi:hypothetical protein
MGSTTKAPKTNAKPKAFKRAATFTVETVNGKRVFTPVNKYAKAYAALIEGGKLNVKQVKAIKTIGVHKVKQYTADGTLKTIVL